MDALADLYRVKLNLPHARFTHIDHEDAMVAAVFKISQANMDDRILKVCCRKEDFLREAYFLNRFAGKLPVPRVIRLLAPEDGLYGAVLMECVPGTLLKAQIVDSALAEATGWLLASIHLEPAEGYGDPIDPISLKADPRIHFRFKFEEGLSECQGHLPVKLLETCRRHFEQDIDLLLSADGPRIIHRDFRPGNLIASETYVTGIIDWSSARCGFAEEDFCPLEFGEWPASCKEAFLKGYARKRPVPNYHVMLPLLRLSRAISIVGFTVKKGIWATSHAKLYQCNRHYLEALA